MLLSVLFVTSLAVWRRETEIVEMEIMMWDVSLQDKYHIAEFTIRYITSSLAKRDRDSRGG